MRLRIARAGKAFRLSGMLGVATRVLKSSMKTIATLLGLLALSLGRDSIAAPEELPELDAILRRFPQGAVVRQPFRMRLVAYFGDRSAPTSMSFEIETIDIQQPHLKLKLGDFIPQTKWKIETFTHKTRQNEETLKDEDVSELLLLNTETKSRGILYLARVVDFPIILGLGRGEPTKK